MKINGYSIINKIADGGTATVYLAEEQDSHERVALKVLLPEKTEDPAILQRFLDEAEILAKLEHQYIIPVVEVGQSDGYAYMAMEYIPGGNLREKILSGVTESEILTIVTQIAEALAYTHLKGVLHLDVTPRNILFKNNGEAVLADFGISRKYLELDFDSTDSVMGNPRYMSPEQIKGEKAGPKTDLYSLGIIFYEMLSGHLPYEAETGVKTARMHLYEVPEPLPVHYSHYQTVIDQLLEKIPERRFHSSKDFLNALGELHSSASVLDDKTVIYPLKQTANGHAHHGAHRVASVINDSTYIAENEPEELESFLDQTDPLSVEEVATDEEKTELMQGEPDEVAKQFVQSKKETDIESDSDEGRHLSEIAEHFSLPVNPSVNTDEDTQIVHLRTDYDDADSKPDSDDSLLKLEPEVVPEVFVDDQSQVSENDATGEFLVDPNVLVAVRDEISTPQPVFEEKRFSLLNILFVLTLIAGAVWLWEHYREEILVVVNDVIQPSEQEEPPVANTNDPATIQDQSSPVIPPQAPAAVSTKPETVRQESTGVIVRQDTIPDPLPIQQPAAKPEKEAEAVLLDEAPPLPAIDEVTAMNAPVEEEPAIDSVLPLTEIVLKDDTGIMLDDDQFVISYELERSIKSHTDNLVREFDGSLRVLLNQEVLYETGSASIKQSGLKLLSRLAYVFRNNQDFKVQVVDRTLQVDNTSSRFRSLSKADNVRDFLIGQGLSEKRIVSNPNSQSYRSSFSGIEIRLIPEILLEPTDS